MRWFFEPIPVPHTDNSPAAQAVQLEMQRAISGEQRILLPFAMSLLGNSQGGGYQARTSRVAESARRATTAEAGIFSSAPSRLDPMSAWEVLGRINAAFDRVHRAGIVYRLTGWFASAYHGAPHSAQAIDIATAAHPEQLRRFFRQEEFGRRRWSKLAQSQPQIEPVVAILKLHWKSLKPALPGKMDFRVKLERGMEQCYTPGWNF